MKNHLQAILAASVIGCLSGCISGKQTSTFNPEAVYRVPAAGMWTTDLVDDATGKKQGRMFVFPGTFLIYDGSEIRWKGLRKSHFAILEELIWKLFSLFFHPDFYRGRLLTITNRITYNQYVA